MANYFDKYDQQETAGSNQSNYFDKYDEGPQKAATYSGLGHNTVAGINEGIAKTLGYPADVVGGLVNQGAYAVNKIARAAGYPRKSLSDVVTGNEPKLLPDNIQPFGGSESIKHWMSATGVENPDTVEANTPTERIFRAGGEGAGSMVTGAGMVSGAKTLAGAAAPRLLSALETVVGRPTPTTAVTGATTGAGSQTGAEVAPEGWKTPASIAGGIGGGFIPAGSRILYEGGKFAVNAASHALQPFTKTGQETMAGQRIFSAASNPYAVMHNLETSQGEIVPGSRPTTFQQTGDLGLGQLERSVRTQNPDDFLQRAAEQNAARRGAIQGVQATGSPTDVSAHFRGLRDSLDRVTETAVNAATQQRNQATAAMGGGGTAEGYGAAMRAPAQDARDAAKEAERSLWNTVDPHGNLVMLATPIASTARNIESQLSRAAKPLSGEERDIFNVARSLDENTPFQEVRDLRGRISAAMSEELRNSGRTPTYARLTQLRTVVERTIDQAVENRARFEQIAVNQGRMSEEDTIAANLRRAQEKWYADRQASVASGEGNTGGVARGGQNAPASVSRAGSPAGGASANNAGAQGVQGVPLDAAAAQRLREASSATRERATTFDEGATGAILKPGSRSGEYRMPNSLVPSKVFHPGPNGGEDVRHYVNAVGPDIAHPAIADYAAFSLRKAAMRPDGSIDTAKALAWARQHDSALAELPPALRSRLANPGRAEEAVAQATATRREQLENFDRSSIARVMGTEHGDVVRQVGSIFESRNAASQMDELARAARGNPNAQAGLRRAVIEHIQSKFMTNAEAATSEQSMLKADAFQTFMRTKADVLGKIFTPKEIDNLRAVSQDIQRANRSINATKLPGGSNTAQDTANRAGQNASILNQLAVEAAVATAGHAVTNSATGGIAGWVATRIGRSLRDAGIKNVDDLVKDAMLDPDLARELLKKVPPKSADESWGRIKRTLLKTATSIAINAK